MNPLRGFDIFLDWVCYNNDSPYGESRVYQYSWFTIVTLIAPQEPIIVDNSTEIRVADLLL